MKIRIQYFFVFTLIIASSLVFAGQEYTMNDVYGKGGIAYDKKFKKTINGVVKKYYESGGLKDEMIFKDGKPNGIMKRYYQSGKLMGKILYENGKAISGYMFEESGREVKMTASNIAELNNRH